MGELSQDEQTVLLIAAQGESLAPIGRWEKPLLALAERGYMRKLDPFNYVITDAGRAASQQEDRRNVQAVAGLHQEAKEIQGNIQQFAEQAAQLLAAAGKASADITGDAPSAAVDKWTETIRKRAQEIICTS